MQERILGAASVVARIPVRSQCDLSVHALLEPLIFQPTTHEAESMSQKPSWKPGGSIACLVMVTAIGLSPSSRGAAPDVAPVLPDGPKVASLVARAEMDAGTQWRTEFDFLCRGIGAAANKPTDPVIEPVRLFDNLYAIGRTSTVTFAVTTSDGIVLIDAGYADDVQTVLLPGMQRLGLDPAQIRKVIIMHGHADHYGGAKFLQDTYAAKIYITAEDWALATTPAPTPAGTPARGNFVEPPRPDMTIVPEQPIRQGSVEFTPVSVPGHTAGAIGLIFPVSDGGKRHVAGLQGGAFLLQARVTDDGLRQYAGGVQHFADMASKLGVDVELENHPMYDNMADKLQMLAARKQGPAHPFVIGVDAYQKFLRVMSGCAEAELERRIAARPAIN
jgi:metallo-beta-lactamase class B